MKKALTCLIVVLLLVGMQITSMAEDQNIVIVGDSASAKHSDLDDLQLNEPVEITDLAIITPHNFDFWPNPDKPIEYYYCLEYNILNISNRKNNYLKKATCKIVFSDKFEFEGDLIQRTNINYDENGEITSHTPVWMEKGEAINMREGTVLEISPFYVGEFYTIIPLPIAVVESEDSLIMIITHDGFEMTYNIR